MFEKCWKNFKKCSKIIECKHQLQFQNHLWIGKGGRLIISNYYVTTAEPASVSNGPQELLLFTTTCPQAARMPSLQVISLTFMEKPGSQAIFFFFCY